MAPQRALQAEVIERKHVGPPHVEDEKHFMMECPVYDDLRGIMLTKKLKEMSRDKCLQTLLYGPEQERAIWFIERAMRRRWRTLRMEPIAVN